MGEGVAPKLHVDRIKVEVVGEFPQGRGARTQTSSVDDQDIEVSGVPRRVWASGVRTDECRADECDEQHGDDEALPTGPAGGRQVGGTGEDRVRHAVHGSIEPVCIADPTSPSQTAPRIRIAQGVVGGPPPPLAGALAAWVLRAGGEVMVVDPRGEVETVAPSGSDGWPLWVHLELGVGPERFVGLPTSDVVAFGPGVDTDDGSRMFFAACPQGRIVRGDPEAGVGGTKLDDLSVLPVTTFAGFGPQPGGLFRLLAGRGDRVRTPSAVLREVIYLVETHQLGHILFDDEDLAAYGDWLKEFEVGLSHLPWSVTWQGHVGR